MTLEEIFRILDIKLSKKLIYRKNEEIQVVTGFLPHVISKTGIFFDINDENCSIDSLKKAIANNSIIVTNKVYLDKNNKELDVVKISNPKEKYHKFGKYLKNRKKVPTVGITGSIGKSTTTRMAIYVFNEKYKVFSSNATSNIPEYYIKELYDHLDDDYDFHIQETGGARPNLVKESVEILDVDAFCLTNINRFHHIDKYITTENLIKDKTSYDAYSKKDAVGIINADDEILMSHKYNRNIITFGIKNQQATYIAKNIKQNEDNLSLDIFHNKKKEISIKINIIGKHNAYNVLAVYALAKYFKLTNDEIINGFLKYKSAGLRQNYVNIGGRLVYIDCFNVCSDSIKSCLDSLEELSISSSSKKIAILGGENALGDKTYEINYNSGKKLTKYKTIDKFIFVGTLTDNKDKINLLGDGKALYDGAKTILKEDKISFYDDIITLSNFISDETKPGDIILLKGIFRLGLVGALDLAFGTSYIYKIFYFINNTKKVSNSDFSGRVVRTINKVDLKECLAKNKTKLIIPDEIENYEVVHLEKGLCSSCKAKKIILGKNLKNISSLAFNNCDNLKEIIIPSNIKLIDNKAFYNCKNLKKVKIKEGVLQINQKAFSNCPKLKKVYLPKSIIKMDINVFPKNQKIKYITIKNSYARNYVKKKKKKLMILRRIKRKIKHIIKYKKK